MESVLEVLLTMIVASFTICVIPTMGIVTFIIIKNLFSDRS